MLAGKYPGQLNKGLYFPLLLLREYQGNKREDMSSGFEVEKPSAG